jgi:hypothetical protein
MASYHLYRITVAKNAANFTPSNYNPKLLAGDGANDRTEPSCEIYWVAAPTMGNAITMTQDLAFKEFGPMAEVIEIQFKQNRVVVVP